MKRSWILFVSARHFRTKRREKGHTAGILSVLGIATGVMTLIAVLAVMNGFQFGTIEDILEIGSYHLQVDFPPEAQASAPTDASSLLAGLPGVRVAVPYAETYGLAYGYFPDPLAIVVRAVPPDVLDRDPTLAANLEVVSGRWAIDPGSVVCGQELARRLGVRVGDTVEIVGFSGSLAAGAATTTSFELAGIFKSGFLEYDAGWAFLGLGGGSGALDVDVPSRLGVKLEDRFRDRIVARRIRGALPGARVESCATTTARSSARCGLRRR
ncbi:MAG: ABC transporter permease [Spirochaetota bacterium]